MSTANGSGQIAVIAPFRAQVALLRRALEAEFPDNADGIRGMVDTVDRFQGSESDVVIVSFANWNDHVHELLQDERRLNVALTRARHKLVLVGSEMVLRRDPTYSALLSAIEDATPYGDWKHDGLSYLSGRIR